MYRLSALSVRWHPPGIRHRIAFAEIASPGYRRVDRRSEATPGHEEPADSGGHEAKEEEHTASIVLLQAHEREAEGLERQVSACVQ